MRRLAIGGALLLGLMAGDASASARPVRIAALEGLPPDVRSREEFMSGLHAAFAQSTLPTLQAGELVERTHDFVLADSASSPTWELHLVIGAPPLLRDIVRDKKGKLVSQKPNGRRASRGLTLVLTTRSPVAVAEGERPAAERIGLVLPEPEGHAAQAAVTRGVEYRWDQAGLATGRVALEALLRAAGEASTVEWSADLQPVRRVASPR